MFCGVLFIGLVFLFCCLLVVVLGFFLVEAEMLLLSCFNKKVMHPG